MKRLFLTLVLASVSIFFVSCTQNAENAAPASPGVAAPSVAENRTTESEIVQLERDWVAAIVNKDLAALDRTLAEDFVGTSVKGGVFRKTDAIGDIKNGVY